MSLTFYAVRHNGKYFKRTGYGGGQQWVVGALEGATIYSRRSQALSRCTWWARNAGITPELVRLAVTVDGTESVGKHIAAALKKPSAAERAEVGRRRREYERAKAAYEAVKP